MNLGETIYQLRTKNNLSQADLYLQFATGINRSVVLWAIRGNAWNIQAIFTLCMMIFYVVMIVITVLRFRSNPMKVSGKNVAFTFTLWVLYCFSFIPIYPDYTSRESIRHFQTIASSISFAANIVLPIALVLSARLINTYRKNRQRT